MHLHFLLLVKNINILFLFIIFNLYQNPESTRGGEYQYSDFKIARPYVSVGPNFTSNQIVSNDWEVKNPQVKTYGFVKTVVNITLYCSRGCVVGREIIVFFVYFLCWHSQV